MLAVCRISAHTRSRFQPDGWLDGRPRRWGRRSSPVRKAAGLLRETSGCAHGGGVRPDQRVFLAASAGDVRRLARHRAPRVHCVDESGAVAAAAPGGPGRTRRPGRAGLDLRDRRRGVGAGEKGGSLTGSNPVYRGKKGSELHVLSEAQGIPLAVAVSAANTHDSLALKPLIRGIPAIRSRRGPRRRRPGKLRADKAYFSADHLAWLRERGLIPRIAHPGIEPSERLGRHRWKIERSIALLFGYRRLTVRYERKGSRFLAFLGLAAALTCYKKLAKHTT